MPEKPDAKYMCVKKNFPIQNYNQLYRLVWKS